MSCNRIYAADNNLNQLSRWMTCYNYYIVVLVMFDEMSICDVMFMFDASMHVEPIRPCCSVRYLQ